MKVTIKRVRAELKAAGLVSAFTAKNAGVVALARITWREQSRARGEAIRDEADRWLAREIASW